MLKIMGKSCTRNVYVEKSIGTTSLESLKTTEYQEDAAISSPQVIPPASTRFTGKAFIVIPPISDIFVSLQDKYITFLGECQAIIRITPTVFVMSELKLHESQHCFSLRNHRFQASVFIHA